jgi:Lipocalin-like domain
MHRFQINRRRSRRFTKENAMKKRTNLSIAVLSGLLCMLLLATKSGMAAQSPKESSVASAPSLVGIWTLTAADNLQPDGSRVHAYGTDPQGILVFGADGRYSVQIFREGRMKFASGDKGHGTPEEYKDASLGMSCHFGRYTVDSAAGAITFHLERASFPNWDGATQTRPFTLKGDDLEWHVPATPDGTIPISAWHRVR